MRLTADRVIAMAAAGVVVIAVGAECWQCNRHRKLAPRLLSRERPQPTRVRIGAGVLTTRRSGGPASGRYPPCREGRLQRLHGNKDHRGNRAAVAALANGAPPAVAPPAHARNGRLATSDLGGRRGG